MFEEENSLPDWDNSSESFSYRPNRHHGITSGSDTKENSYHRRNVDEFKQNYHVQYSDKYSDGDSYHHQSHGHKDKGRPHMSHQHSLDRSTHAQAPQQTSNQTKISAASSAGNASASSSSKHVELLEARSWILAQIEKFSIGIEILSNLKKYISDEVEMDKKMIETHLTPLNTRFRSAAHYQSLPREATIMEEKYQDLLQMLRLVLQEGSECFQSKKLAYQAQMKKVRDNANVAIRNAMQIERGETLVTCQKVREDTDHQVKHLQDAHQQESSRLKELVQTLELTISHLEQRIHVLQEKDQHRLTLQQEAVQSAVQLQRQESQQELTRQQQLLRQDTQQLKDDYEKRLEKAQDTLLQQDRQHQRAIEDLRFQHQQELVQQRQEIHRLQEEYQGLQGQMTFLKEKNQHVLQEERTQHEKALSEQLAESLRAQASMKSDMASMIQQLHVAENKRRQESESQFQRIRDQMSTQHNVDVEQLHDKYQREMKRVRAELEVQYEDQVTKIKHMHEQELNRQIRVTDRLQRVLARHGLGNGAVGSSSNSSNSSAPYTSSSDSAASSNSSSYKPHLLLSKAEEETFRRQLTPTRARARQQQQQQRSQHHDRHHSGDERDRNHAHDDDDHDDDDDDDAENDEYAAPPPPPPPLSYKSTSTSSNSGSNNRINSRSNSSSGNGGKLSWGALSQSLSAQEKRQSSTTTNNNKKPVFSPAHLPPSTFPLDEALASASASNVDKEYGANEHSQTKMVSVSGNVRRVSSYLQALEDYLQGDETAAKDVDISVATSTALSDILHVPNNNDNNSNNSRVVSVRNPSREYSASTAPAKFASNVEVASSLNTLPSVEDPASSSVSVSTGSLLRNLRELHPEGGGGGGGDHLLGDEDDLYVPSDSEDSLHRFYQLQQQKDGPLVTTVLSDT